jgi:hypothetical protein
MSHQAAESYTQQLSDAPLVRLLLLLLLLLLTWQV